MSPSISTTLKQIWKKLSDKEYRDSFVASNIANTVSSQIFSLREQCGWTQKELAQKAGMAQSRISSLEDPNLDNFEIITLKRLASAFDVGLIVRFAPFSELAEWSVSLSTDRLTVPNFANDTPTPKTATSPTLNLQTTGFSLDITKPGLLSDYLWGAGYAVLAGGINNVSTSSAATQILLTPTGWGPVRQTRSPSGIAVERRAWANP